MDRRVLKDRYELVATLGGGSGSTTYLARDSESAAQCVVKELSVGEVVRGHNGAHSFDSDDFTKLIELFEREARVLAHLDHPGIPRFIDHFTESTDDDTRLYTVQEYVEGETLEALIANGRHFTEDEAVDLCRQVTEILRYLHAHSPPLIHRDIKPSNIILAADGTAHVVDFGSVRNAVGGGELDGKTIVGTYGYMPIEQYEARALPQSDLYALGMTLVYLLSHKEPTKITRTGMKLEFRSHMNVSEGLASIIERMIEPAPEDRFASAADLLEALDRGSDIVVRSRDPVARLMTRPAIALGLGGATLVLLIIVRLLMSPGGVPLNESGPDAESGASGVLPPPARTETSEPEPQPPAIVRPIGGVLAVDLYSDFRYRPQGWPMGRSVSQSALPGLSREPMEELSTPSEWGGQGTQVYFGFFPLGNSSDPRISFALVNGAGGWALYVDANNNERLLDDGPPTFNEGSGTVLAAEVSVDVEIMTASGESLTRPYRLWVWFTEPDAMGRIRGRFYARNHYAGAIEVDGQTYLATAFEFRDHDALYRESGLCIDLDLDGECQEDRELFYDGDVVNFRGGTYTLELRYP